MNFKTFAPIVAVLALAACRNDRGAAEDGASDESGGSGGSGETDGTGGTDPTGGELGDCPSDLEFFDRQVWQPILSQTCITCHSESGLAKATRMVLLPAGAEGALEHNLAEAREVALVDEGGTSLLLLKPTGKHAAGHQGGMLIAEDSESYRVLEEFVQRSLGTFTCDGMTPEEAAGCDMGGAGPRRVRRLSHVEYNRTVAAILGAPTELGLKFASDTVVQGYSNNADALLVSGLLADQYREAAETVADQIKAELPTRLGCDPVADGEAACASTFIKDFGKQAFRRPLTATEQGRYEGLWKEAAAAEDFAGGIRWTVAAILQSPNFLYRTELGDHVGAGVYELTPYELASELSYLITGGPPDATLTAAADDGTLKDPATLAAQAERLLAAADSDATLHRFVDEWLHLDRLRTVPRDMTLFPELTPQVREAMLGETHRFASQVFRGGGSLRDLLTAPYSLMTDALAQYYGVPAGGGEADAAGYKQTELATAAGLLAHGSVLTTHALPTTSSPIHRGKVVRERLLCQEMPPPPPSLDTSPPPVDPMLSTRERYIQHSADPTCNGCHQRIDPIGFGFEHYDGVGRWRDMDGAHAIDSTGEIKLTTATDGAFDGVDELAALLAGSPDVAACYTTQWSRFALGSAEASELACVDEELGEAFAEADGRLDSLVLALVGTRFFRERGGAPTDEPVEPGGTTGGGDETGGDETGAGSTGMPETTGDEPGPTTTPGIDVMVVQDSKWEAGECNTVTVTNSTDAPIVWQVGIALPGTMQNAWNCKFTAVDGGFQFTGEAWNAEVAAKTATSFGFCVTY
jgi:hypothetical protein